MLDDAVWRYLPLGPLPTGIIGITGLALLLAVGMCTSKGARRLAVVLFGIATIAILAVTLSGGDASLGRSVSLRPGAGIRGELNNVNHGLGVVNVLGNVLVFVPLGWVTAVLVMYAPSARVLVALRRGGMAGFGFSLAIELSQYFLGRAADVDDVLLNTAGALVGAAIGAALSAARERFASASADGDAGRLPRTSSRGLPL